MKIIIISVFIVSCFLIISPIVLQAYDGLIINGTQTLFYKVTDGESNKTISKTIYKVEQKENKPLFSYIHISKNETWNVLTDSKANPLKTIFKQGNNKIELLFDQKGQVCMTGLWNNKPVNKKELFSDTVTLENALKARTLDLSTDKKQIINLLQTDKFPKLKVFKMYYKVIGEKNIQVKAGVFKCKKVLFTLNDWRSMFYKAYYYISDDNHRYLVKMENVPKNGVSELISIE